MKSFPVQLLVLLFATNYGLTEHLTQEVIVGFFLKFECFDILEVSVEHQAVLSIGFQQVVHLCQLFESTNLSVLFGLAWDLDSLPGQFADEKVEQKIPQRLEVISPTLLVPFMGSDTSIASSTNQTLASLYGDVLLCLEVDVAFGESKVDGIDHLPFFPTPHHEVVSLDIPMNETLSMDLLETSHNLNANRESRCQRKALGT